MYFIAKKLMPSLPRTPPALSPRPTPIGRLSKTGIRPGLEPGLAKGRGYLGLMIGIAKKRAVAAGIEKGIELTHGCYRTGGILGSARLGVSCSQYDVGEHESRIPRGALLQHPRRVRRTARQKIRHPEVQEPSNIKVGIEMKGRLDGGDTFLQCAGEEQGTAEPAIGVRIARVEVIRELKLIDRLVVL